MLYVRKMEGGVADWHHMGGHIGGPVAQTPSAAALCAWPSGQGVGLASTYPGSDPRSGHFYYIRLILFLFCFSLLGFCVLGWVPLCLFYWSLGGSMAGLGCAWIAYRHWAVGRVALCPGAFRCTIFAGCWVGEIVFFVFRWVALCPAVSHCA